MAAFLIVLQTALSFVWSFLSPVKWYILTAIVSIALWQHFAPRTWIEPSGPWTVSARVLQVDTGSSFTVKARAGIFERTRTVNLDGVAIKDDPSAKAYLAKLLSTNEIVLGVTEGSHLGAGDLTAIVYTPDGTCANLALICKRLATCANNKHPEWVEAEQTYGGQ
jgi:hypothetical protein